MSEEASFLKQMEISRRLVAIPWLTEFLPRQARGDARSVGSSGRRFHILMAGIVFFLDCVARTTTMGAIQEKSRGRLNVDYSVARDGAACLALADRLADRLDVSEAPTQIIPTPPPQRLAEDAFLDGYPMEPPGSGVEWWTADTGCAVRRATSFGSTADRVICGKLARDSAGIRTNAPQ